MATSNIITNIEAAVVTTGISIIRPPAGEAWLVSDFSSDAVFITGVPNVQVELTDGVLAPGICLIDPATDPGKRTRQYKFYLTHDLWMLVTNFDGGNANIGVVGEKVNLNNIRSGSMVIAPTAYNIVRPPAGETWCVTEWGASAFTGAGDLNPAVEVGLRTPGGGGLVLSRITRPTQLRAQDKQPNIIINNDVYLNVYSTPGVDFYWSAIRIPETSISSVTDVAGAGLTPWVDIRPNAGDEYIITEIGSEIWAVAVPNGQPDIIVSLRVGADDSEVIENALLASVRWNTDAVLKIDHDHYLRITDNSGGNNEVCVSGYLQRSY
jgi:hypothetical protein